jgi:hypothetical protein
MARHDLLKYEVEIDGRSLDLGYLSLEDRDRLLDFANAAGALAEIIECPDHPQSANALFFTFRDGRLGAKFITCCWKRGVLIDVVGVATNSHFESRCIRSVPPAPETDIEREAIMKPHILRLLSQLFPRDENDTPPA